MGTYETDISVIIPIYNVDEYLYRCLSSVACQTFKNYEVIMINDGSTDNSIHIAKRFSENFQNFRLLDNPRKGVANARNLGVETAKGEYIAFVDSDDYVDPNYLLRMYTAVKENDADIAHCNYILYYMDSGFLHPVRVPKPKAGILSGMKMAKKTISDIYMRSYLWNKLWKRSLFTDNHITFPDMKFEDIATVAKLMYFAKTGVVIQPYLYYYTVRDGSIVKTSSLQNIRDYILSLGMLRRFFMDKGELKQVKYSFLCLTFAMFFANIYNLFRMHMQCKNMKGYLKNVAVSTKNLHYFYTKKFKKAKHQKVELPYAFTEPKDKSKKFQEEIE